MSPRGCEGSRAGRVLRPGGDADGGGFVLLCLTTAVLRTELVLRLQRLPLTDASCAFAPRIVTWDLEHSAPDLLNPTAKNQDRKRLPKVDGTQPNERAADCAMLCRSRSKPLGSCAIPKFRLVEERWRNNPYILQKHAPEVARCAALDRNLMMLSGSVVG